MGKLTVSMVYVQVGKLLISHYQRVSYFLVKSHVSSVLLIHYTDWFLSGSLYWVIIIPNAMGSIIHQQIINQQSSISAIHSYHGPYLHGENPISITIWLFNIAMENPRTK